MSVPEARLDPVLRRYELRSVRIPVGKGSLGLVVPAGREWLREGTWARLADAAAAPPYWVEVWPAALGATWAIARLAGREGLAGLRVLDLGCGLGLPGIAAAALGAAVTFSDLETDALAFARWNARRVAPAAGLVCTVPGDWRELVLNRQFDLIVLADVSYETELHAALRRVVVGALAPGGVVLHADPERAESSAFLEALPADWSMVQHWRRVPRGDQRIGVRLALTGGPGASEVLDRWSDRLRSAPAPGPAAGTSAGGARG